MERTISNEIAHELTIDQLDAATGGGLLKFFKQVLNMGNEDTNTDPNLATHTTSYKVYVS
jgi:hypothetical protein